MILRAVTVNVEAAHSDSNGRLHGHSYLVECWTGLDVDLPTFEARMRQLASSVDHTTLETRIGAPTMEALGEWFLRSGGLVKVVVRRPTLGYLVEVC